MSTNISNNYKLRGSLSIVLNSRTVLTELTEIYRGGEVIIARDLALDLAAAGLKNT